jgi:hypothetical protein
VTRKQDSEKQNKQNINDKKGFRWEIRKSWRNRRKELRVIGLAYIKRLLLDLISLSFSVFFCSFVSHSSFMYSIYWPAQVSPWIPLIGYTRNVEKTTTQQILTYCWQVWNC